MKIIFSLLRIASFFIVVGGFLYWQLYLMAYHDFKEEDNTAMAKSKPLISAIYITLREAQGIYMGTGKFSEDPINYSMINLSEVKPVKYSIKIKSNPDIFIVFASSQDTDTHTVFGAVKAIESNRKVDLNKNKNLDRALTTSYFICYAEKYDTPLPSELDIANLNDKCPVGYLKPK